MPELATYGRQNDAQTDYPALTPAVLARQIAARRIAELDDLVRRLTAAAATGGAEFANLIALAQPLLTLDDLEMAKLLKVSRPTISRWVRGISTPHPLMRKPIFDALVKKARAQVKTLRK
jgi:hypothetical protein